MNKVSRENMLNILREVTDSGEPGGLNVEVFSDDARRMVMEQVKCKIEDGEPCKICGGSGFVAIDIEPGNEHFGKIIRCENNPVIKDQEQLNKYREFGNMEKFANSGFSDFNTTPDLAGYEERHYDILREVRDSCIKYSDNPHGFLVLSGNYGTGKTTLAGIVGTSILENKGKIVVFNTVPALLDHFRSAFSPKSKETFDDVFANCRNAEVLILDDFGAESSTEWARDKLFQIINYRYSNKMPTIVTTNLLLDDMDPRISSRLKDSSVCEHIKLDVPDYREQGYYREADNTINKLHLHSSMTLDSFNVNASEHWAREMEQISNLKRTIDSFTEDSKPFLYLWSRGSGNGKTHVAAAIANIWASGKHSVCISMLSAILDELRKATNNNDGDSLSALSRYIETVDLLVIDRYKPGAGGGWVSDKMLSMIEARFLAKKHTIFTSRQNPVSLNIEFKSRILDKRNSEAIELILRPYYEVAQ